MAAVHRALSGLEHQPAGPGGSLTEQQRNALCEARNDWPDFDKRSAAISRVLDTVSGWLLQALEKLLEKSGGARRPSADRLELFDESNKLLRDFWFKVESSMEIVLRDRFNLPADKAERYSEMMTWRRHEYSAVLAKGREEVEDFVETQGKRRLRLMFDGVADPPLAHAHRRRSTTNRAATATTMQTAPFSQTVWGEEKKSAVRAAPLKEKIKTRAPSTPTIGPSVEPPEPVTNSAQNPQRIAVNADSLELFSRMFTPSATARQHAGVDWDDLVAAFVDAGCSMKQGAGSAVVFLCEGAGFGSVVIHKPHPDPSIYPIQFREAGKRVEKHLGWNAETFVLREKKKSGGAWALFGL
ncbi:hypothetical protein LTR85_003247 [Meristemomyces frigidus]|nr:hypothetical protein LTR85_003247 [Meristemomyces frigidus]